MQMLLITLLSIAMLAVATIAFFHLRLRTQHRVLQAEHGTLHADNERLTEQHRLLTEQSTASREHQDQLRQQHDELVGVHEALKGLHTSLRQEHDALIEQRDVVLERYNDLSTKHAQLKDQLRTIDDLNGMKRRQLSTQAAQDAAALARIQRVAQGYSAKSEVAKEVVSEDAIVYPEAQRTVLERIQALLDQKQAGKDYASMEFCPRDPLPGNEDVDHVERCCIALRATGATGRRVHISDVVLEALENWGWETNATKAQIAVLNMYNSIKPPRHGNRLLVENYTVMLRGTKIWFPAAPKQQLKPPAATE